MLEESSSWGIRDLTFFLFYLGFFSVDYLSLPFSFYFSFYFVMIYWKLSRSLFCPNLRVSLLLVVLIG